MLVASTALCSNGGAAHALGLGIGASIGFNTHAMHVWSDDLNAANAAGADFNSVKHSFTYGAAARAWIRPSWLLEAAWEPILLSSSDPASTRKLSFDATSVRVDAGWFVPSARRWRAGLGVGIGSTSLHGSRESGGIRNADLTGHTLGVDVL